MKHALLSKHLCHLPGIFQSFKETIVYPSAASYPHLLFIFQLNNFVTHPLAIPKMLPPFPQPQTVN